MQAMQRRATTQLAQQADLGVFWGVCERLEALCGMRARERRLGDYWTCAAVLKLCVFDLLLASSRLHLLANAPKHHQIRLLRQQHRRTNFASPAFVSCTRAHNATS